MSADAPRATANSTANPQPSRPAGTAGDVPGSLIFSPPSYFQELGLLDLFPRPRPLEIELGSGDGSFLVEYARRQSESNFLGVERLLGRLRKIDRKGQRARLSNLRLIRVEAGYFLEYLLPAQCACALHVYFPDPWPKRKHRKHRLINARFAELAVRVLGPAGRIYLRTDDPDYYTQMLAVFRENSRFRQVETPFALADQLTDFERDFQARGIHTLRTAYERA